MIGSGVADITGPAAEIGMMGYAMLDQQTAGIHQRLRSRAFVIASPCNGRRVAFVSADLGMIFQAVKQGVVRKLRASYGDLYDDANVLLSATHTHSGPGGFSHYTLYDLTTLGYDPQNYQAIVDGIVRSIARAHENLAEGTLTIAKGDVSEVSINRSPGAYALNPRAERAFFAASTDIKMTLVKLQETSGREVGLINWLAVHATSMGNDNLLISGDNKGYASYLFEKQKGTRYGAAKTFVAAFAQADEGDSTPNIYGGTDGGGANDFESTQISGEKQYNKARELYDVASELLVGGVDYRHAHVKMDAVNVAPRWTNGQWEHTCPAAIGISMLAGAEDGPGYGSEGFTCEDVANLWDKFVCATLTTPCQAEKPIVLEMGATLPFPWSPEVLPLQIVTLGDLALVAVPYEPTTMAGRRLLDIVRAELQPAGIRHLVIAGLSNAYAGYVATREEYAAQQYEGASTHFGPWTLAAYQQEFARLASALRDGEPVAPGPPPRDLSCCVIGLQPGVVFDDKPLNENFGSVYQNAHASYRRGDLVKVIFWGAHPKNDLKTESTYLEVQKKVRGVWRTLARDWDWDTKYSWKRNYCFPTFACSHATTEWAIPADALPGTYRIRHYGNWKSGWDAVIRPYTGTSREFTVN